jgi:hypothetical protein
MNSETATTAPISTTACEIAKRYLVAMERREMDEAARLVHPQARYVFPGGATRSSLAEIVEGSAKRYQFVGKVIERCDSSPEADGRTVVYVLGTLYGRWADGTSFDGIRFVDRFEIEAGLIRLQEVWNDVGQLLSR